MCIELGLSLETAASKTIYVCTDSVSEGKLLMPNPRPQPQLPSKEVVSLAFGAAIRKWREAQSLTQEQLAALANLHPNYVSTVERGERNLTLHNVVRLACALDVPLSRLLSSLDQHTHPVR